MKKLRSRSNIGDVFFRKNSDFFFTTYWISVSVQTYTKTTSNTCFCLKKKNLHRFAGGLLLKFNQYTEICHNNSLFISLTLVSPAYKKFTKFLYYSLCDFYSESCFTHFVEAKNVSQPAEPATSVYAAGGSDFASMWNSCHSL